jgi:AcrR family transcriptional regulator
MVSASEHAAEAEAGQGCDEPCLAKRRDKAATKQALLRAAVEVFAQRGYDGATTKEVAARAGVNEGLIQRYFAGTNAAGDAVGGKAGLLQAIVGGLCGEKLAACRLAPPGECLKAEIAGFLRHEVEQASANRDVMRVMLSRALVDPELAAALREHYRQSRLPLLVARLRHFQQDGRLDAAVDLQTLATTLVTFGFGLGFMQQVVLAEDPKRLEAVIATLAETVVRGLAPEGRGARNDV